MNTLIEDSDIFIAVVLWTELIIFSRGKSSIV